MVRRFNVLLASERGESPKVRMFNLNQESVIPHTPPQETVRDITMLSMLEPLEEFDGDEQQLDRSLAALSCFTSVEKLCVFASDDDLLRKLQLAKNRFPDIRYLSIQSVYPHGPTRTSMYVNIPDYIECVWLGIQAPVVHFDWLPVFLVACPCSNVVVEFATYAQFPLDKMFNAISENHDLRMVDVRAPSELPEKFHDAVIALLGDSEGLEHLILPLTRFRKDLLQMLKSDLQSHKTLETFVMPAAHIAGDARFDKGFARAVQQGMKRRKPVPSLVMQPAAAGPDESYVTAAVRMLADRVEELRNIG